MRCIPSLETRPCFEMRITEEQERRMANWRRRRPDLPCRQEAIRRLLDRLLDAVEMELDENS